ncbi:MAG: ATP-binding protein [Thermodesulfobacteriota bacterium]
MGFWQGLGKIRVRLALGFGAAFLGMALFGALSYYYFLGMEQKLFFLSQADNMLNTVLEARRYEKNYFLYHHQEDFQQALAYLDQHQTLLQAERQRLTRTSGAAAWQALRSLADDYRRHFLASHQLLAAGAAANDPRLQAAEVGLRASGKALIEKSEAAARQERQDISLLLREYRPLLAVFLAVLAGIGGLLAWVLIARLVRPLYTIEEATQVVAQGQFATIPWKGGQDEIGSLVHGFNRMVVQLRQNNEQMVQTEKLTALGTLTSGVAHELNNPLNNISTSCQILLEELGQEVSAYHRELLTAIEGQVHKARDIVSSLLEFARQREFELKREELRAVVEEALKLVRGEVPHSVQLRVDVPRDIVLELDKHHMVQALLNLILNAVQAMKRGGLLTIRGRQDRQQNRVLLEVADTGQGILPEVLPRIFDPFFTTKEVGQGTGLGLSITYGIIERHHGHIQAQSEPGRGARFIISLPLGADEE